MYGFSRSHSWTIGSGYLGLGILVIIVDFCSTSASHTLPCSLRPAQAGPTAITELIQQSIHAIICWPCSFSPQFWCVDLKCLKWTLGDAIQLPNPPKSQRSALPPTESGITRGGTVRQFDKCMPWLCPAYGCLLTSTPIQAATVCCHWIANTML